ncbi:hypothetical protein EYF80_019300 [Liparis tanakae]|uniref:Uncharacterized protein n=1 Tax=Liparis tanakae TaxID=230148 RepID=A0A4Z2HZN0_9TELE|nr:hypothetical protein EYF80_019300 [Liparis tanakae]
MLYIKSRGEHLGTQSELHQSPPASRGKAAFPPTQSAIKGRKKRTFEFFGINQEKLEPNVQQEEYDPESLNVSSNKPIDLLDEQVAAVDGRFSRLRYVTAVTTPRHFPATFINSIKLFPKDRVRSEGLTRDTSIVE